MPLVYVLWKVNCTTLQFLSLFLGISINIYTAGRAIATHLFSLFLANAKIAPFPPSILNELQTLKFIKANLDLEPEKYHQN